MAELNTSLPPALHRSTVDKFRTRAPRSTELEPDHALDALAGALDRARAAAEQIHSAHVAIMADELQTEISRQRSSRRQAFRKFDGIAPALDKARTLAASEISRIERETQTPPPPRTAVEAMMDGEMRATLAMMKPEQRTKALAEDQRLVGACLRAPAAVSGMTVNEQNAARANWQRQLHADVLERKIRLEKAVTVFDNGTKAMLAWCDGMTDGEKIAVAEDREAKAKAAAA